jgi:hypothetical protein
VTDYTNHEPPTLREIEEFWMPETDGFDPYDDKYDFRHGQSKPVISITNAVANKVLNQDISESSTGGKKEVKNEQMDLLPLDTLALVSRVYAFGTRKYAAHNWRKGYEWSKSEAALLRHFTAFVSGEDYDSETQEPHLSSVIFHALALLTWSQDPTLRAKFDDRYKKPLTHDFPPSTL